MHRFFISPAIFAADNISFDPEISHQLARVLRLAPGAPVLVLDGLGNEAEAILGDVPKNGPVTAKIIERRPAVGDPAVKITLYQALLKGEKFDWLLQKGTEVGISAFVPVITERCISESARLDRWNKIIKEAAEQSRRGRLPEIHSPVSFEKALDKMGSATLPIICWEEAHGSPFRRILNNFSSPPEEVAILIGPEGGLSAAEVEAAHERGIVAAGLGPRVLRAETAGPVAAALVLYHYHQME